MFRKRIDPFSALLRPPLNFTGEEEQFAYMRKVGDALSWVDSLDLPVLIADAMVSHCPTVAVSDAFVRESLYPREEVLFRNCKFLVERVTGPDVYHISRSVQEAMKTFCKMSRYPGAVDSGGAIRATQPNLLGDGSCVTNHFVFFRVYVCGHPLLVGLHNFDETRAQNPSEELNDINSQRMASLSAQIAQSEKLRELFQSTETHREIETRGGLYRGDRVSSNLVFFAGGYGVLRQEPQFLPQSGTIFTERPIPLRSDGSRRITLRLETVMSQTWPEQAGPAMGFTLTTPGSADIEDYTKLHFVSRTVGFTCIGPVVNNSKVTLQGTGKWRDQLDIFPMQALPELVAGDIITVEVTSAGELKRYRNGTLLSTVATNQSLDDGEWYGAFEVSMNVACATFLEVDPYLDMTQVNHCAERQFTQILDIECKLTEQIGIMDLKDIFGMLLTNARNLSVTVASVHGDNSLLAVSDGFRRLTGYRRRDVIGHNCRFLNKGGMSDKDRADIRQALKMGEHFCAVLPNFRADGTPFDNLLDLRTLEVGIDGKGAPVRYIVGIQAEITHKQRPNKWRRELPALSQVLQCNLAIILQALQNEFQISDGTSIVTAHPLPFWIDEPFHFK
mmetsp:Transcript_7545/g.12348  ORF Transcript_7545/g.12348 Transcript_7545/m.12348 type:complete len:617 (-) Transcript_7545:171-2021(-)